MERLLGCAHLSEAVDFANRRGLIHRDIKPDNILIQEPFHFLLADLGIAYVFPDFEKRTDLALEIPDTKHPRFYMSPEQLLIARGEAGHDKLSRSDRYQVGAVTHEVLFGFHPNTPPRAIPDYIPGFLRLAIARFLEKDGAARPELGLLTATLHAAFNAAYASLAKVVRNLTPYQRNTLYELFSRGSDDEAAAGLAYFAAGFNTKLLLEAVTRVDTRWRLSPIGFDLRRLITGQYSALIAHAERLGRLTTEPMSVEAIRRPSDAVLRASDPVPRAQTGSLTIRAPVRIASKWWLEVYEAGDGRLTFDAASHVFRGDTCCARI